MNTPLFKILPPVILLTSSLLISCGPKGGSSSSNSADAGGITNGDAPSVVSEDQHVVAATYDMNLHPLNKTVCDPFNNETSPGIQSGIKASLYYLDASQPRYTMVNDYLTKGHKSEQTLFFNDLNVPTRLFNTGFAPQMGTPVKDDQGNMLIEYFALKFEGSITLPNSMPEGNYEFALLSDDGANLKVLKNGLWTTIVSNDSDHPTRMGCANQVLNFQHGTEYPFEVDYYQGPRFHISNILMWRKADQAGKDSLCGKLGNNYFFDPDHNSVPLQPYKDLLARGWSVVPQEVYTIPQEVQYNSCVAGTAPVISNFQVLEIFSMDAILSFQTDINGTSQVKVTNTSTGEVTLTNSDNNLRTSHTVQISNLTPNTTYKVQAISISDDFGRGMSQELTITTTQ